MAITIRWAVAVDTNWTHARVYRSTSRTGTFTQIVQVVIGTTSYIDSDGSSSNWYKVSFWDGVNESSLSDPVQGDTTANYCDLALFRKLSNFSTSEISDTDAVALMPIASRLVHRKVMTKHKLERDFITRIDGTNTILYTKHKPIGDADMDSDVDIDDVQVFYATWDVNNLRNYGAAQTVSSIDARGGRITMVTAPTTTTARAGIFHTYFSTVEDLDYSEVRVAATYMLAHLASMKIRGEAANFNVIKDAPYLRQNISGVIGEAFDSRRYQWLRAAYDIIFDIIGKGGKDGIGLRRVDAISR